MAPSGLYARLCHAFLVISMYHREDYADVTDYAVSLLLSVVCSQDCTYFQHRVYMF